MASLRLTYVLFLFLTLPRDLGFILVLLQLVFSGEKELAFSFLVTQ